MFIVEQNSVEIDFVVRRSRIRRAHCAKTRRHPFCRTPALHEYIETAGRLLITLSVQLCARRDGRLDVMQRGAGASRGTICVKQDLLHVLARSANLLEGLYI